MALFNNIRFAVNFILLMLSIQNIKCHVISERNYTEMFKTNTLVNLLDIVGGVVHTAKEVAVFETSLDSKSSEKPMDCAEIQENNALTKNGIYEIWPRSRVVKGPLNVYCDFSSDGGGWTIIQRRGDFNSAKDYFYRNWNEYKSGFGDIAKDFWIGNDNIFALTSQRANTLHFYLEDWEGNTTYAEYEEFWIDDEAHNYTSHVSGFRGKTGNGFGYTNGLAFTTQDRDNDPHPQNCAVLFKGAWWYEKCHSSNLNGQYLKGAHESYADGVNWSSFRGNNYSLKTTIIGIRPRNFVRKFEMDVTPN